MIPAQDVSQRLLGGLLLFIRVSDSQQGHQFVVCRRAEQFFDGLGMALVVGVNPAGAKAVSAGSDDDVFGRGTAVLDVGFGVAAGKDRDAGTGLAAEAAIAGDIGDLAANGRVGDNDKDPALL